MVGAREKKPELSTVYPQDIHRHLKLIPIAYFLWKSYPQKMCITLMNVEKYALHEAFLRNYLYGL
jgi:hypothetical protein